MRGDGRGDEHIDLFEALPGGGGHGVHAIEAAEVFVGRQGAGVAHPGPNVGVKAFVPGGEVLLEKGVELGGDRSADVDIDVDVGLNVNMDVHVSINVRGQH